MGDFAPLRIGMTGSRTWRSTDAIRAALTDACYRARPHRGHVLVHGQCDPWHPETRRPIPWLRAKRLRTEVQGRLLGADWLAEWVVLNMLRDDDRACGPWRLEGHPADWWPADRFDRAAGFRRNEVMVSLGADEWEAFADRCVKPGCRGPQPHDSHGTADCADRARKAGIPVRPFTSF